MAKYVQKMTKATSSTSVGMFSLEGAATLPRRFRLYDLIVGSEAAAADNALLFTVERITATGTGTAVTPKALDPADQACLAVAKDNLSGQPTVTATSVLLDIPLNQRAVFRWVAAPGSELIAPATTANGFIVNTPTATNTPAVSGTMFFDEA